MYQTLDIAVVFYACEVQFFTCIMMIYAGTNQFMPNLIVTSQSFGPMPISVLSMTTRLNLKRKLDEPVFVYCAILVF